MVGAGCGTDGRDRRPGREVQHRSGSHLSCSPPVLEGGRSGVAVRVAGLRRSGERVVGTSPARDRGARPRVVRPAGAGATAAVLSYATDDPPAPCVANLEFPADRPRGEISRTPPGRRSAGGGPGVHGQRQPPGGVERVASGAGEVRGEAGGVLVDQSGGCPARVGRGGDHLI